MNLMSLLTYVNVIIYISMLKSLAVIWMLSNVSHPAAQYMSCDFICNCFVCSNDGKSVELLLFYYYTIGSI